MLLGGFYDTQGIPLYDCLNCSNGVQVVPNGVALSTCHFGGHVCLFFCCTFWELPRCRPTGFGKTRRSGFACTGGSSCVGRLGQRDQQLLRPALARSDQNGQVYRALMQTFHRLIEVT